jgi:DNA adenine methylase
MALAAFDLGYGAARPVLKWAGGKGQLLPQINQLLPVELKTGEIKRYVEPFLGGGAVFFDLLNKYDFDEVILSDINPELVILYNIIKNNVGDLTAELGRIQSEYYSVSDQKKYYYARRDEYNDSAKPMSVNLVVSDSVRRAALTIFLNRTCFNGLFRVNSRGKFNVPMGRYNNPKILDAENLRNVSSALHKATIVQADFSHVLDYANGNTFIYYDPPYRPVRETSNFNSFACGGFNDSEQARLKEIFARAHEKGALQMLSNSDPTNYSADLFFDALYKDFKINRVMAKRLINSKADGRDAIRELIITNY